MHVLMATPAPPHPAALCPYGEMCTALTQPGPGVPGLGLNVVSVGLFGCLDHNLPPEQTRPPPTGTLWGGAKPYPGCRQVGATFRSCFGPENGNSVI